MAINKYGVPGDNYGDERLPTIQPKFKNRFRVFFYDFGDQKLSLTGVGNQGTLATDQHRLAVTSNVISFNKPAVSYSQTHLGSFIGQGTIAGRPTWENLNITLRDDIKNAGMKFIMRQAYLQQQKYIPTSSAFGRNFTFGVMLEIMDGRVGHTGIERWFFRGCSIVNMNPGDVSYESDTDYQRIDLNIAFNNMYVFSPARINFASAHRYNEEGGRSTSIEELSQAAVQETGILDQIYGSVSSATDSLIGAVGGAIDQVIDAGTNFVNRTLGDQFNFIDSQIDRATTGFTSGINTVTDAATGAISSGADYASGLFNRL